MRLEVRGFPSKLASFRVANGKRRTRASCEQEDEIEGESQWRDTDSFSVEVRPGRRGMHGSLKPHSGPRSSTVRDQRFAWTLLNGSARAALLVKVAHSQLYTFLGTSFRNSRENNTHRDVLQALGTLPSVPLAAQCPSRRADHERLDEMNRSRHSRRRRFRSDWTVNLSVSR